MKSYLLLLLFWLYAIITWIVNASKLLMLLLDPNNSNLSNHTILHILGLFPPLNLVLAWF